jgi:type II secretory pathway component PulJ
MSTSTLNQALTQQVEGECRRLDRARNLIDKRDRRIAELEDRETVLVAALEKLAWAGREADETGLPVGRFLTVTRAVAIAKAALASGRIQNTEETR